MYDAKVIADSVSLDFQRLVTIEVTLPRPYLAEFNTHRVFSRNSASSRAIPVAKQMARIKTDPFIPIHWGTNQPGMQAGAEIDEELRVHAVKNWLAARDVALLQAENLLALNIHKQVVNRLLEPFMWHTIIVTATEWDNFFALRRHEAADPHIRRAAELMFDAMASSTPTEVPEGEWHLPYVQDDEWSQFDPETLAKISSARCARVSYLTHDGKVDTDADLKLYERLASMGHMSPMEHPAEPNEDCEAWSGNFRGWKQFRKSLPYEDDFSMRGFDE